MDLSPRIETLHEKKLIGRHLRMSLADNMTHALWRSFKPRINEVTNTIGSELYSLQWFDTDYFPNFNPSNTFDKVAAIEVSDFAFVPEGLETFIIPSGLYAVFLYRGSSRGGNDVFQYIFGSWLPASNYILDNRPHFEILGAKYRNDDVDSEEEIWIPIATKNPL